MRRALRGVRDRWSYARHVRRLGPPDHVLTFGSGGIGDDLLGSTACREFARRGERNNWVLGHNRTLFADNPDIAATFIYNDEFFEFLQRRGHHVARLRYNVYHQAEGRDDPPAEHILAAMCRGAGLRGEVALRPWLHLTPAERAVTADARGAILLQSSGRSARYFMRTKEWLPERFNDVAAALARTHRLIQIGGRDDPPIAGAQDLRGRTSIRETAALLAGGALFIGVVGFLMHLARAVDCRAVIVYGGRELPAQSGYVANENLSRAVPCAPCWSWQRCDHDMRCMREISSGDVIAAAERVLAAGGGPLPVAFADLDRAPAPLPSRIAQSLADPT